MPKQQASGDTGEIVITYADEARLRSMLATHASSMDADPRAIERLDRVLASAKRTGMRDLPTEVVTMNSYVVFQDERSNTREHARLVYARDAADRRLSATTPVSVLEPLGTALLGLRVGQQLDWAVGQDVTRLRVLAVPYQPESAGHFHL